MLKRLGDRAKCGVNIRDHPASARKGSAHTFKRIPNSKMLKHNIREF